ncbi:MAG: hypothetical protein KDF64_17195, partial [Geminicoccaceae bacterium]|nr:hypothetical protein [Geminicoccaceae bacterium]
DVRFEGDGPPEQGRRGRVPQDALAGVLTGGGSADPVEAVGEDAVLALERAAFMRLVREEATLQRMEHTLGTGRPLRN